MDGQKELELWREGGILHDKFAQKIERLERELAECKAKAIDYEVKRDVAVNTLDLVKAERTAAQKALAAQCTETKVLRQERYALAAQAVQMREALEMISNTTDETGVCGNGYSASYVAEQAISINTKPAEQIINSVKAHALREVADAIGSYVISDLALRKRANELENK